MSMRMNIAGRNIGLDSPPYIIAEAGVHHYNSLEIAKEYILSAKIAGADAIKFQTYKASRLAAKWAPTYWDDKSGKTQHDIFAEREGLTDDDYSQMFAFARAVGITMLSTPFDDESARMLARHDMAAYKIASADITNHPLLREVARFGKPMILSTGAAEIAEIESAINLLAQEEVIPALLHCNLSYPTKLHDANLRRIPVLAERFERLLIGYSDHTQPQDSPLPCAVAVALGARIIEKHFTLNKQADGDDHYHAVDLSGLKRLVRDCKDAYDMSHSYREITESEQAARSFARRSIVAATDLEEGHELRPDDVDFKRPGTGLSPVHVEEVLGKKLVRSVVADEQISLEDVR